MQSLVYEPSQQLSAERERERESERDFGLTFHRQAPCRGVTKGWFSKRVVLADVPPERKPEQGYIRMFPRIETGTRVRSHVLPERKPERGHIEHSQKPPFYETVLLSSGDQEARKSINIKNLGGKPPSQTQWAVGRKPLSQTPPQGPLTRKFVNVWGLSSLQTTGKRPA